MRRSKVRSRRRCGLEIGDMSQVMLLSRTVARCDEDGTIRGSSRKVGRVE